MYLALPNLATLYSYFRVDTVSFHSCQPAHVNENSVSSAIPESWCATCMLPMKPEFRQCWLICYHKTLWWEDVSLPSSGVTEQSPPLGGRLLRNECSTTDSNDPGVHVVRTARWFCPPTNTNGRRYKVWLLAPWTEDIFNAICSIC